MKDTTINSSGINIQASYQGIIPQFKRQRVATPQDKMQSVDVSTQGPSPRYTTRDECFEPLRNPITKPLTMVEIDPLLSQLEVVKRAVEDDKQLSLVTKNVPQIQALGFDINSKLEGYYSGETLLHLAARAGCVKVVEALVAFGANVEFEDNDGATPLHFAATEMNSDMVKTLLESGAKANSRDRVGFTPLHAIACADDVDDEDHIIEIIKSLLSKGENINVENKQGSRPLDDALKFDNQQVVRALLKCGAECILEDKPYNISSLGSIYEALHSKKLSIDSWDKLRAIMDHALIMSVSSYP